MATYDDKRKGFSRTPVWYVKLTLDFCANTFGSAPCTAIGTGDKKCFNTFFTCKDSANYSRTTKVYRFVTNGALPFNDGERPYIAAVSQLPTEIKTPLPTLGRIKAQFYDEPDTDVGIDPYVSDRSRPIRGTFWRKFLKRNPNYKGRIMEVYEGYIDIPESEFQLRFRGRIDNITIGTGGIVEVEGIDFIGDLKRVTLPPEYDVKLAATASTAAAIITFTGNDVAKLAGSATGETIYLRSGAEIMSYLSSNYDSTSNQITGMSRGVAGTVPEQLPANDDIVFVPHYNGNVFDVMHQLLVNPTSIVTNPGAAISTVYVNTTAFEYWRDFSGISTEVIVDGYVDEAIKADEAYFDLINLMDVMTWVGEDNRITCARRVPNAPGRVYHRLSDEGNITIGTDSFNQNEESRYTRNYLLWDYLPGSDFDKVKNFSRADILVDLDLESSNAYGEQILQMDKTRFFRQGIMSQDGQNRFIANRQKRWLAYRRDAQPLIDVTLEHKDSNIKTGDYCKVATDLFTNDLGAPVTSAICLVTRRAISNDHVMVRLEKQRDSKIAFIAPTTNGGGSSDYQQANDSSINYGYIAAADSASSTAAVMGNGAPAYRIY